MNDPVRLQNVGYRDLAMSPFASIMRIPEDQIAEADTDSPGLSSACVVAEKQFKTMLSMYIQGKVR